MKFQIFFAAIFVACTNVKGAPYGDEPSVVASLDELLISLDIEALVRNNFEENFEGNFEDNLLEEKDTELLIQETLKKFKSIASVQECPPNKQDAIYYAHLTDLAYKPYSEVRTKIKEIDNSLNVEHRIYDSSTHTNGFIASNSEVVVVAFRGTEITSIKNLITDLSFFKETFAPNIECHGGFVDAYNSVSNDVKNKVSQLMQGRKKLVITGHSLGGALATLMTYGLRDYQPEMFVYGCPPVCTTDFASIFDGRSKVITIKGDPVSTGFIVSSLKFFIGLVKPAKDYIIGNSYNLLLHASGKGILNHSISTYIKQLEKLC